MSEWQGYLRQLSDVKQEKQVASQITGRVQKVFSSDKHPSEGFIVCEAILRDAGRQFRVSQVTQRRAVLIMVKVIVSSVNFPDSTALAAADVSNCKGFLGASLDIIGDGVRDPEAAVRNASLSALHEVLRKFHQVVVIERLVQTLRILQLAVTSNEAQLRAAVDMSDTLRQIATDVGTRAEQTATESAFKVVEFVGFLDEAFDSVNQTSIVWLLKWIEHVSKLPRADLAIHLPDFIEKMFRQISLFPDADVPKSLNMVLWPSVAGLQTDKVRQGSILSDLMLRVVTFCHSNDVSTRYTALDWVNKLLANGGQQMFPLAHEIIGPILEQVGSTEEAGRIAVLINDNFSKLIRQSFPSKEKQEFSVSFKRLLETVLFRLQHGDENTKLAALKWIVLIHDASRDESPSSGGVSEPIVPHSLFLSIVTTLPNASDGVLRETVAALVEVAGESNFGKFIESLLLEVSRNSGSMLVKLPSIILQLQLYYQGESLECPEKLYLQIAAILPRHGDKRFVAKVVNSLHMMLLTLKEMLPLRTLLRRGLGDSVAKSTFSGLFGCWAFDPVAAVGLCLLTSAFEPALDLVEDLGRSEVTTTTLVQLDRLAQLFESPVFAFVRTGLLKPRRNAALLRTLFGIQMILPQSSQPCKSIRARLKAAPTIAHLPGGTDDDAPLPFDRLWWCPLFAEHQRIQQELLQFESKKAGGMQ